MQNSKPEVHRLDKVGPNGAVQSHTVVVSVREDHGAGMQRFDRLHLTPSEARKLSKKLLEILP